jgi:hypothetical protein
MYSYSLAFYNSDPLGSTNYGKLTNVSISPQASPESLIAAAGSAPVGSGQNYAQTFEFIIIGVNANIIRISGGEKPVLHNRCRWDREVPGQREDFVPLIACC